MVTVEVEVDGEKQVVRKLLRVSQAPDLRPIAEAVRHLFFEAELEQFDSQGHSGSGGWAPLKPRTVARKVAQGLDPRILRAKEDLFRSVTSAGSENAIFRADSDTLLVGTKDPKAKLHQRGTRKMPQRKVIDLNERNRRAIVKLVQAEVMAAAK
jgi:phage gpG-like protein